MRHKKLFSVSGILLIVLAAFYFFKPGEMITNYPPKNSKVVAFGDSLIHGTGSTPGNDFVSQLSRNLGIKIENRGRIGETTVTALTQVDSILELDPGIVILLLGGNDVLRQVPKEATFRNLEIIIQKFQKNGTLVMLLGVRGGFLFDAYEDDYENLAKKYHIPYVSNVLKGVISQRHLMSDSIHPNDEGYKVIAGRVTNAMEDILK